MSRLALASPRLHTSHLTVRAPADFDFWRTAYSHGWCDLPPFTFDPSERTLGRIFDPGRGRLLACTLKAARGGITVHASSREPITASEQRIVLNQIRTCLRLDEDFGPFYAAARTHPAFRWVAASRAGRLLRAPTVFEDVVKMICTTNCTWALTRIMVTNLVRIAGRPLFGTSCAFPDAAAVAALTERRMRADVKAGYRAPFLLELAERVASGKLSIETWRTSTLPTDQLQKEIRQIKGVGPYAAENILKLLGRYDHLGLDSWVRGRFAELHCRGRRVKDSTIERHYKPYGTWRGLFFWLEMTRDWHADKVDRPDF